MAIVGGRRKIGTKKSYAQLAEMIEKEKSSTTKDPKTNPTKQLTEYKSWVSNCVSLIFDTVKTIPFKFYRSDTNEEITSRLHSYKTFAKPFLKPNPIMSMTFLKAFCQMQQDLCGMSCIYKAKNQLSQTWEFWPLNMNDFYGVFAVDGTPIEMCKDILPQDVIYVFMIGGKYYKFSDRELIINKYPHPKNPWIGASPVQLQAYAVDIQTYMEVYERDFFRNSARIDGLVTSDFDIDQPKADEIKGRWQEKYSYSRGGSFHEIAVLGSGLNFTPIEWANKDLEFLALTQWTEDLILGAYRVPKGKLGKTESSNRSSSVQSDIYFARESIQPRLSIWDDEFTEVVQEFDKRLYVKHDNPIPRDRQLEVNETRVYLAGAPLYRINELRNPHNLPPDPQGDRILIPNGFVFLDRLDDIIDAGLKAKENPKANETDPDRHENDDPKVDPDGSDSRDDSPTDGRSINDFNIFVKDAWNEKVIDCLWKFKIRSDEEISRSLNSLFILLYNSSIKTASFAMGRNLSIDEDWVNTISTRISREMMGTISNSSLRYFNEFDEFKKFLDSNIRFVKILNYGINSCVNFVNYSLIQSKGLNMKWDFGCNSCGHKGRIKENIVKDNFLIGNTKMRFPGEIFVLGCNCFLSPVERKE